MPPRSCGGSVKPAGSDGALSLPLLDEPRIVFPAPVRLHGRYSLPLRR
jgi:hypothetical protein